MSETRQQRRAAARDAAKGPQIRIAPPSDFPKVVIKGGPTGKDVDMTIDGGKPKKVHRVEIVADVNEVVRVTTYQFAEIHVEVETPGSEDGGWIVALRAPDIGPGPDDRIVIRAWRTIAEAKGKDLAAVVHALADAIPVNFEVPPA